MLSFLQNKFLKLLLLTPGLPLHKPSPDSIENHLTSTMIQVAFLLSYNCRSCWHSAALPFSCLFPSSAGVFLCYIVSSLSALCVYCPSFLICRCSPCRLFYELRVSFIRIRLVSLWTISSSIIKQLQVSWLIVKCCDINCLVLCHRYKSSRYMQ
jgi:hypothetical protein